MTQDELIFLILTYWYKIVAKMLRVLGGEDICCLQLLWKKVKNKHRTEIYVDARLFRYAVLAGFYFKAGGFYQRLFQIPSVAYFEVDF